MKTTMNAFVIAVLKTSSREIAKGKQNKTLLERFMKNLTLQLRLASLLTLILLACITAFGQLTPSGDSYTSTATPTKNFGSAITLGVESSETTYIQFNLSSIPSGYTSADITKATLKLFVDGVTKAGSFNVDYVNGTWAESTIDASNAPALGTTIAASVPLTTADKDQYILVDVTAAVQAWLSGTANDGIALVANSPLDATFDSKEATKTSHTAELDIVFAGGGTLTGVTTASGSGLTGGGTSGTLNLSLTNGCAANQVLQYNGSSWVCAAVGTGTITGVTAGTDLLGGGTSGNVTLSLNTAATNGLYAQLGAANTFATNQTVDGTITANSSGNAIVGTTSASGVPVWGISTAATGFTLGVLGQTTSTAGGVAVVGQTAGEDFYYFTNAAIGMEGETNTPAGVGVWGLDTASTGIATGVYGTSASSSGVGVWGVDTASTGTAVGVYGTSASSSGAGVWGGDTAATGSTFGVYGQASSPGGWGVAGTSPFAGVVGYPNGEYDISVLGAPYGVVGSSPTVAVYGAASGLSALGGSLPHNIGVWGDYGGATSGVGITGSADTYVAGAFYNNGSTFPTLYAENETTTAGGEVFFADLPNLLANGAAAIIGDPGCGAGYMAIQLGQTGMSGCNNYTLTGGSNGDSYLNAFTGSTVHLRVNNVDALRATNTGVAVVGTLSKGGGSFMIDHPLDPANKYLYHSFVESPDMMNIYNGNVTTDGAGLATVTLPDWFGTLNRDFRYQLTVIGQFAQAIVASEISGNQFGIRTDKPSVKVSWQVTGIRQDAFANANRIPVEVEKAPADRGRYLYPEAIGAPASARIGYEAPPAGSGQIVHHERPSLHSGNGSPAQRITLHAPPNPVLPRVAPLPHAAPLPHPPTQASKLEVNQK